MRYEHKGAAVKTTTTAEVADNALSIPLAVADGWPDGTVGPFWVCLNKGTLTEEKVLCSGRSNLVLTVFSDAGGNGRGRDDTVARTHPINSTVEHVWTAQEAEDANVHANAGDGAHGYPPKDTLATLTGAQTLHDKVMVGMSADAAVLTDPATTGGHHTGATELTGDKVAAVGAQAPLEFRARNIVLSTADPTAADGEDGSVWIKYV